MVDWFKKLKGLFLEGWGDVMSLFLNTKPDTDVYLLYIHATLPQYALVMDVLKKWDLKTQQIRLK